MANGNIFWLMIVLYFISVTASLDTTNSCDDTVLADVKDSHKTLQHDAWGCRLLGEKCDCSNIGLFIVPPFNSDKKFKDCTELDLSKNAIDSIKNCSLQGYKKLKRLKFNQNNISTLHAGAFVGLENLEYLSMAENRLAMTKQTFPVGIFAPLTSLQVLELHDNADDSNLADQTFQYPDEALADLKNLANLSLDGLRSKKFGPGFRQMISLRNLTLTGNCRLGNITSETFTNLQGLQFFNLSFCDIHKESFDTNSLSVLTNLEFLDISWSEDVTLQKMTDVLQAWNNSKLTRLKMEAIESRYATGVCINVNNSLSLPRSLRILEAASNVIEEVDHRVFESLPVNLSILDLSDNWLIFGSYLANFHKMENLETLFLDGRENAYGLPNRYPKRSPNSVCERRCGDHGYLRGGEDFGSSRSFRLPHNLKNLSITNANLCYRLTKFQIDFNNSLTKLSLSGNILPNLKGPFIGFHKLEELSIRESRIQNVSETFFQNMTSLKYLDLSGNIFGLSYRHLENHGIFENLKQLKVLNLSYNAIQKNTFIQLHSFKGLNQLEELYLQGNQLWNLNTDISHMTRLRILNLSNTAMTQLDAKTRNAVDHLIHELNVTIQIDMSHNPILCNCSNKDFIQWMAESAAFKETLNYPGYLCAFYNADWYYINDGYQKMAQQLRRSCSPKYKIFIEAVGFSVIIMAGVLSALVYHFRWRIRYFYYGVYLQFKEKRRNHTQTYFPYDVFISYAFNDEEFVMGNVLPELTKRGLKLHVHGRDFVVGDYIASNIVTAVKSSRKTLVILTHALINSNWCHYELQMANMESVFTGRQVLLFLLKESMDSRDLSTHLLTHIRNNTYTNYPDIEGQEEETVLTAFWDKLASDLKQ